MSGSPTDFSRRPSVQKLSVAAMILSAACWGSTTVVSKSILDVLPPLTLLVTQLAASVTCLWAATLWQQSHIPCNWKTLRLGFPGLLEPGFSYTFGTVGLAITTASNASLIGTAEPIMIVGLAWLLLRERISPPLLALSVMAIVGVLLTVGVSSAAKQSLLGDLLLVVSTGCAALYVVLSRRDVERLAPLSLASLQQSVGLIWAVLVWLFALRHGEAKLLTNVPPETWIWAAVSGIVQYALAFWLYLTALRGVPVSIAAQFLALIPVFGVGGAYLFLGERLTMTQGLGIVLILGAVLGISRLHNSERES